VTRVSRPLVITDCDEVLMHMVVPFGEWLAEDHGIDFRLEGANFRGALSHRSTGAVLEPEEVWPLLDGFFRDQMHRQKPIAVDALERLADHADIVILTNIGDDHADARTQQLSAVGIPHRVVGNRGGKGGPVAALVAEYAPSLVLFIDDLAQHHASVERHAPDVWRLHMVGEPAIAHVLPAADRAHVRIDDWAGAEAWLMARIAEGQAASLIAPEPENGVERS
jgi:hypothetical protein